MGMKKIKGKKGFYEVEKGFYRLYTHKPAFHLYNQGKDFRAAYLEAENQVVIYHHRNYLIIEADKSLIFKIGKLIKNDMSLDELIDTLFKNNLLNYNMKWSRMSTEELDINNKDNFPLISLRWI